MRPHHGARRYLSVVPAFTQTLGGTARTAKIASPRPAVKCASVSTPAQLSSGCAVHRSYSSFGYQSVPRPSGVESRMVHIGMRSGAPRREFVDELAVALVPGGDNLPVSK